MVPALTELTIPWLQYLPRLKKKLQQALVSAWPSAALEEASVSHCFGHCYSAIVNKSIIFEVWSHSDDVVSPVQQMQIYGLIPPIWEASTECKSEEGFATQVLRYWCSLTYYHTATELLAKNYHLLQNVCNIIGLIRPVHIMTTHTPVTGKHDLPVGLMKGARYALTF